MYTVYDFVTHIKGQEYIIAILFIAFFVIFWEALKPKPFLSFTTHCKEDVEHLKKAGWKSNIKSVAAVIAAPLIGLLYIFTLPFVFIGILLTIAVEQGVKIIKRRPRS